MRVLVDTSVWSLALRRGGPAEDPAVVRLQEFLDSGEDLFLSSLILQEILQAFRSEAMASRVASHLEPFPLLPAVAEISLAAASLYKLCKEKGLGASTIDCHIAASAIENGCQLLTTDRDFAQMTTVSPLRLA